MIRKKTGKFLYVSEIICIFAFQNIIPGGNLTKNLMKQMTKQLLFLFALCGVMTARAADGDTFTAKSTEGIEITFKVISESDKTCQVGDNRNCCLADKTIEGSLTIPETVNGYRVTEIGYCAFSSCENLKSFNLPASIVLIGEEAFWHCTALEELTLPQNCFLNLVAKILQNFDLAKRKRIFLHS